MIHVHCLHGICMNPILI